MHCVHNIAFNKVDYTQLELQYIQKKKSTFQGKGSSTFYFIFYFSNLKSAAIFWEGVHFRALQNASLKARSSLPAYSHWHQQYVSHIGIFSYLYTEEYIIFFPFSRINQQID